MLAERLMLDLLGVPAHVLEYSLKQPTRTTDMARPKHAEVDALQTLSDQISALRYRPCDTGNSRPIKMYAFPR